MENITLENRSASRSLYALLELLAVSAGTSTAIFCAVTFGVANLMDVSQWSAEKLEDIAPGSWVAEFSSGHAQADCTSRFMTIAVICGLLAVAAVVGLCVLTGRFSRDEEGKIDLNWFDRLWSELHLVIGCTSASGAVAAAIPIARMVSCSNKVGPFDMSKVFSPIEADAYMFGISNNTVFWYCAAGIAACLTIAVICFVTLVKKLKAHDLIHSSLTGKILGMLGIGAAFAGRGVAKAGKGLAKAGQDIAERNKSAVRLFTIPNDEDRRAARKLMIKYSLIAVMLIGLPVFFMIMSGEYEWML